MCCERLQAVLDALNRETQSQGLENEVQVTTCGCLGLCDDGPIVIVYPDGVWYRRVTPEDVPEIVSAHLGAGKVVARLQWTDAPAMKARVAGTSRTRQGRTARARAGGNAAGGSRQPHSRLLAEPRNPDGARTGSVHRRGRRRFGGGRRRPIEDAARAPRKCC